ncbi:MAG TPA: acylphosphatase [Bacillota bacterium]|nr:acylphosphatase [Bacillota bacterium]
MAGFVRNCLDGSVEAAVEGEADGVMAFVDWCAQGPRAAAVTGVEVSEESPLGEREFHICPRVRAGGTRAYHKR